MSTSYRPEGYHNVTPYLTIAGAAEALDFYKRAFGAEEVFRMPMGDRIGHAEIRIGDSVVMLSDEFPEMGCLGPKARGGATSSLMVYVEDVDSAYQQALDAGAIQERPVEDQFWGDRMGSLVDPFGHRWSLATHVREVSPEEMQAAMAEMTNTAPQPQPA